MSRRFPATLAILLSFGIAPYAHAQTAAQANIQIAPGTPNSLNLSAGSTPTVLGSFPTGGLFTPFANQPTTTISATGTLSASSRGQLIVLNASSSSTLTLSTASYAAGFTFDLQNNGAGGWAITPTTGLINNSSSFSLSSGQGAHITFDGTNYVSVAGTSPASAGVASLNTATGALTLNGANGVTVSTVGNTITASSSAPRVATTNDTVATSDCGGKIELNGGSGTFFSETLPAASGFSAGCVIQISNSDNVRGKLLSGFPTNTAPILWPNQTVAVGVVGSSWVLLKSAGPWTWGASETFHVNHTSGSAPTATDCLGTGSQACDTIQHAADNVIQAQMDCHGFQPFIQVDDSIFAESVSLNGKRCTGVNNLQIVGNPSSPASVQWESPAAGEPALASRDTAVTVINGFLIEGAASGGIGLLAQQNGVLAFENINFGNMGGGTHLECDSGGRLVYEGGIYFISAATFINHLTMNGECSFNPLAGTTIFAGTTMNFTDFYSLNGSGSAVNTNMNYSGPTANGTQYFVGGNASLILNGTTLPGNVAGGTGTGGQVQP